MRVAVIYHSPHSTDRLDDALVEVRAQVDRYHLDQGDPVPENLSYDRVVVLGGAMGAYDCDRFPWLAPEKRWLANLVEAEVPVLGICLGAQLLADSLGGRAYKADEPEVAVTELKMTAAGRRDPIVSLARPVVFSLHKDSFELPPGSDLLARTDRFPHAFRHGSALALQFHPDADLKRALAWGKKNWSILELAGVGFEEYAAQLTAADADLDRSSRDIFKTWLI
jgi:GMP synthase (glutamine-hydrolysing)